MVVDESARHTLHERLDDVLGREVAATLMAHLPPVGWRDVVSKRDLDVGLDALGDRLRAEFYRSQVSQTRTLVFSMTSVMLILAALAFGAARVV